MPSQQQSRGVIRATGSCTRAPSLRPSTAALSSGNTLRPTCRTPHPRQHLHQRRHRTFVSASPQDLRVQAPRLRARLHLRLRPRLRQPIAALKTGMWANAPSRGGQHGLVMMPSGATGAVVAAALVQSARCNSITAATATPALPPPQASPQLPPPPPPLLPLRLLMFQRLQPKLPPPQQKHQRPDQSGREQPRSPRIEIWEGVPWRSGQRASVMALTSAQSACGPKLLR